MYQLGAESFETWETPEYGSKLKCKKLLFGGCIPTMPCVRRMDLDLNIQSNSYRQDFFHMTKSGIFSVMSGYGFPHRTNPTSGRLVH